MVDPKVTELQKSTVIECLEARKQLLHPKFNASFTRQDWKTQWDEIAQALNSDANGPTKTAEKWRIWFNDKRSKIKTKYSKMVASRKRTGGGPVENVNFTPFKEGVLALINDTAVVGMKEVAETKAPFTEEGDPTLRESVIFKEPDNEGYDSDEYAMQAGSYRNLESAEQLATENEESFDNLIFEDEDFDLDNMPPNDGPSTSGINRKKQQQQKMKAVDDMDEDFDLENTNCGPSTSCDNKNKQRKRTMKAVDVIAECAEKNARLTQRFNDETLKLQRSELEVKARLAKSAEDGKCVIS